MDRELFEKVKKKIEKETEVNADNIEAFPFRIPKLYFQILDIYSTEKRVLSELKGSLSTLYREKYHHYKFDVDFSVGNSKGDIEAYIFGDEDYHSKKLEYDFQSIVVEYLEKSLETIKNINFIINNYVAIQKLKHGLS